MTETALLSHPKWWLSLPTLPQASYSCLTLVWVACHTLCGQQWGTTAGPVFSRDTWVKWHCRLQDAAVGIAELVLTLCTCSLYQSEPFGWQFLLRPTLWNNSSTFLPLFWMSDISSVTWLELCQCHRHRRWSSCGRGDAALEGPSFLRLWDVAVLIALNSCAALLCSLCSVSAKRKDADWWRR